jgi:DNA-binding CsgD family transcriptional regulator
MIMKIEACIRKPWKIPKDLERLYNAKNIEIALSAFDRASKDNFYMVDYLNQKLITGIHRSHTLSGYSKDVLEIEGFDFYERVLSKGEMKWLVNVNKEAHNVFYDYPVEERLNLEFSYDLVAENINKHKIILQHRLVPYKLCKNGNMWLGLCHVEASSFLTIHSKASIVNYKTGEQFEYIDGKFLPTVAKSLTTDEIAILSHMAKDLQRKEIAEMLKVSEASIKKKKQTLFNKLNVKTSTAAVYKATVMKLI